MHNSHMMVVNSIVRKKFISEMDLLRLRRALMGARMAADSTFLCDKTEPSFSSKLERLRELLAGLIAEPERKILVFSEWTTMLNLIEPILRELHAPFLRLDGSVPQAKRKQLVAEFQRNPECRVFLTTNAGSTGLNLQAADTVINVDLPWNPALLEQRIARAHRMGQKRKVQVYLLVTERTIEESLLATLGAKHELAAAVLDPDSKLTEVQLVSGTEELKRRLEVLLGAAPGGARRRLGGRPARKPKPRRSRSAGRASPPPAASSSPPRSSSSASSSPPPLPRPIRSSRRPSRPASPSASSRSPTAPRNSR